MDRVAVFVDAGYLFAQGSKTLSGQKLPRGCMVLDVDSATQVLREFAEGVSGLPLLRIYWYDGTSTGPTSQHLALAFTAGVKLKLGFLNAQGEQKGVDSLIVTDMIELARNRAMTDALLLSGDEDLRVGVQQAQEFGVKVHLLGIAPSHGSQSQFLLQEADTTHEWNAEALRRFLTCSTQAAQAPAGATSGAIPVSVATAATGGPPNAWRDLVTQRVTTLDEVRLQAALRSYDREKCPRPDIDRPLLGGAKKALGRTLTSAERAALRSTFAEVVRTQRAVA